MTNINVKELITDPDFARPFQIERHSGGTFVDGLYSSLSNTIDIYGIIQPYQPKTVEYLPNGDQITGDIKIWSLTPIYTTRHNVSTNTREANENNNQQTTVDSGISDIIIYKGERYKVTYVKDWEYHGYYSAVAKRISAK